MTKNMYRREYNWQRCLIDMKHMHVDSYDHTFSEGFDENTDTEEVYSATTKHLLLHAMDGGKAVCMM